MFLPLCPAGIRADRASGYPCSSHSKIYLASFFILMPIFESITDRGLARTLRVSSRVFPLRIARPPLRACWRGRIRGCLPLRGTIGVRRLEGSWLIAYACRRSSICGCPTETILLRYVPTAHPEIAEPEIRCHFVSRLIW